MLRTLRSLALASLLIVAACSGNDGGATDTTAPSTTAAPTTTVAAPAIEVAEVQPHATNVLLATLTVTTDTPARLNVML
ncbi:MAG: hypothetical protein KGR47_06370, partial [Acidobacteria bacterium]|nr:hypothetical protein [Acidobacteriota bacterium]